MQSDSRPRALALARALASRARRVASRDDARARRTSRRPRFALDIARVARVRVTLRLTRGARGTRARARARDAHERARERTRERRRRARRRANARARARATRGGIDRGGIDSRRRCFEDARAR